MLALLLMATIASPQALPKNPPECVQYFHAACNEALGEWLPTFSKSSVFWDAATHVSVRDAFVYESEPSEPSDRFGFEGPADGTSFVYGFAGKPAGRVVYDYAHRIAFYEYGCCSGLDVVAAYAAPPPTTVGDRDLRALKTVRGIHLGMTSAEVTFIYGSATPQRVAYFPDVDVLPYTTWPPSKEETMIHSPCGQFENFYFRDDRLVLIQLGNGC
jgi:hypothetical protein